MKNPYFPTALGLYFNYLVHGMGVILMSLNMASLETLWQTNAAGVSIVISSLGIGRLSVLLFAGLLSDRFGRRPFIMLGMCCYMAFFFGILHTNNIIIAYVFGFLAGMANSFLDAGTVRTICCRHVIHYVDQTTQYLHRGFAALCIYYRSTHS